MLYLNFDTAILLFGKYKETIEKASTLIIFISIPTAYFCGQFIQSIDVIFYSVSVKLWASYSKKPIRLKMFFYKLISGHRISGNLNLRSITANEFWKKCNELELVSKYTHAEYSFVMNALFHGITLICCIFTTYSFFIFNFKNGFSFLFLSSIFWLRAKFYATIFIDTVLSTREALDNIKPESIKSK